MRPIRLFIENFMCYDTVELDLTSFSSALIVGEINGNDLYSNGTGKSTIFKAIEYVLFNKARETNLEKLVRDDTNKCKVTLDLEVNGKIYRISRSRTIKGTSDLTLLERNAFQDDTIDPHSSSLTEEQIKLFWTNIAGRRAQDTEDDIKKLLKINFEAFLSTNHFVQNDYNGLPTATAGQRKKILKEALLLVVYAKLEKLASEEAKTFSKELDRKRGAVSTLGDPQKDIEALIPKTAHLDSQIEVKPIKTEFKNVEKQ